MKKAPIIAAIIAVSVLLIFVILNGAANLVQSLSALQALGYSGTSSYGIVGLCGIGAAVLIVIVYGIIKKPWKNGMENDGNKTIRFKKNKRKDRKDA